MKEMTLNELTQDLRVALTEWRDAGAPVEDVVDAIVRLAVKAGGGIVKMEQENRT